MSERSPLGRENESADSNLTKVDERGHPRRWARGPWVNYCDKLPLNSFYHTLLLWAVRPCSCFLVIVDSLSQFHLWSIELAPTKVCQIELNEHCCIHQYLFLFRPLPGLEFSNGEYLGWWHHSSNPVQWEVSVGTDHRALASWAVEQSMLLFIHILFFLPVGKSCNSVPWILLARHFFSHISLR